MREDTVNAVETTGEATRANKVEKKTAKKDKKPGLFHGLRREYKEIIFADRKTVVKQAAAMLFVSTAIGVMTAILNFIIRFGLNFTL